MNTECLLDAIGGVCGDYVLDAHEKKGAIPHSYLRWGALAACVCILAGLLLWRGVFPAKTGGDPAVDPVVDPAMEQPPSTEVACDWPVVFNESDTSVGSGDWDYAEYFNLFSEEITPEQLAAVLPERLPEALTLESGYTSWFGWNEVEGVVLYFRGGMGWSGDVSVTIRPADHPLFIDRDYLFMEESTAIPTHVEDMDVVLYKTAGDWGEEMHTTFLRRGSLYTVTAFAVPGGDFRQAEDEFFQMVVSIVRGGQEISFDEWKPMRSHAEG